MAQQSSRLQRLLTLLDTGSTQGTRFSAARQIGEISKSHPQDLSALLSKVAQYLHSKKWDTRVAAAHAIGAIAENVKHVSVTELFNSVNMRMSECGTSPASDDMLSSLNFNSGTEPDISFRSFDLNKVLEFGALVASWGQEYDVAIDNSKNPKERLARQKQNLKRRLGLDVCEQFMDVGEMIRDEDLMTSKINFPGNGISSHYLSAQPSRNIQQLVTRMVPTSRSRRPSARELNLLKRKAKSNSKDQPKVWAKDGETDVAKQAHDMASLKNISAEPSNSNKPFTDTISDDETSENDGDGGWPFQSFVDQLLIDIFDPVWEVRHGSIMALREILTYQGASAGIPKPEIRHLGRSISNLKEDEESATKKEREIDLNLEVSVDEPEPLSKRQKLECAAYSDIGSSNGAQDLCVKVEDDGVKTLPMHTNGEGNVGHMKVEAQPGTDSASPSKSVTIEAKDYSENKELVENMDVFKNISQPPELANLVNQARTSWLKNCEFLQDCAIRFLCVLSLDRFGDYVSDQVVAPVRETCAQALGVVLKYMHPTLVQGTLHILLQMQRRPEWEIRHGSLLGIKYLVAVRQVYIYSMDELFLLSYRFFNYLLFHHDLILLLGSSV